MDIHEAENLKKYADELRVKAGLYAKFRTAAGKAKADIDILLAAQIGEYRTEKKNLGYDMALLMLMENNDVAQRLYREMTENTSKYKALERIIDSLSATIMLYQSIMKYEIKGAGVE